MNTRYRSLYDHMASGGAPDAEDLATVPPAYRGTVKSDRKRIHALHAEGHNGPARQLARDLAARLEQQVGDWEPEPTPASPEDNDPRALAARIRRH